MMKYVVFKFHNLYIPVVVPNCCTHKQISIKGAKPVSAGFFEIGQYNIIKISNLGSDSLKLEPNIKRDKKLLDLLVSGDQNTASFLEYNFS